MGGFIILLLAGRVKVKESEARTGGGSLKRKRVQDLSSDEEVPGNHTPFNYCFITVLPDPPPIGT